MGLWHSIMASFLYIYMLNISLKGWVLDFYPNIAKAYTWLLKVEENETSQPFSQLIIKMAPFMYVRNILNGFWMADNKFSSNKVGRDKKITATRFLQMRIFLQASGCFQFGIGRQISIRRASSQENTLSVQSDWVHGKFLEIWFFCFAFSPWLTIDNLISVVWSFDFIY